MPRRGFIGVDIGGSVMAAGVVTPEGEVVAQVQDPTHKRGPGTAVATLLDLVQRMHLAARAFGVTVEGIGIGVPGTVRGEGGYGGELGHVPINCDGRACICGGQGCLKTYVSGTDIALIGTERLKRDVTAADVFRMADEGNPACQ